MRLAFSHVISTDSASFWKLFFDADYNEERHRIGLGFPVFEILALDKAEDGSLSRRLRLEPKLSIPKVFERLVGDSAASIEEGRYDPKTGRYTWQVTLLGLGEKVRIEGELWLEERKDGGVDRHVKAEIAARLLGIGGLVESFIAKGIENNYSKAARFTNNWLARRGLAISGCGAEPGS